MIDKFVNKIIAKALEKKASSIHIEPLEEALHISFRKEGIIQQNFPFIEKQFYLDMICRIKILANLNTLETRKPQEGIMSLICQGRRVRVGVFILPSIYGEKVVLRLLNESKLIMSLDELIINRETRKIVTKMTERTEGLIIAAGSAGTGKTTILYSLLAQLNNPGINVYTIEDFIECQIPGVTQMQVEREKGMDFSSYIQAVMRQEPDVIMVGETTDKETAKNVIDAALDGNLVLTALHAFNAAGAIVRLDEMGIEPYLVSEALIGVINQGLLRRVCSDCAIAYTPTPQELSRYGNLASYLGKATIYKAKKGMRRDFAKARGDICLSCNGIGYQGWVGVYEVLPVTKKIKFLINQGARVDIIEKVAREEGMKNFLDYALHLVLQKHTTLKEIDCQGFYMQSIWGNLKSYYRQQIQQL